MNLTTERIKQILDGAFDERLGDFKLVVRNRLYKRDGKGWLSKRIDGTGLTNKLQPNNENVQNLSDLREILTLRQRVQELEDAINKINDAGTIVSCDNAITEAVALVPQPPKPPERHG